MKIFDSFELTILNSALCHPDGIATKQKKSQVLCRFPRLDSFY